MKIVLFVILCCVLLHSVAFAEDVMDKTAITPVPADDTLYIIDNGAADGRATIAAVLEAGEATLEAVMDLQDMQGAVTDAQVPDDITITNAVYSTDFPLNQNTTGLAATATALAADPANCGTATHFSVGVNASGVAECEAISDADVPNDITVTLAATATALVANGANCTAGSYPLGVNASGAVEDCTDATTEIDSAIAIHMAIISDTSTVGHLSDTDWNTFNNKITESTSVTAPLVLSTYALSIPVATTSADGYLSQTDWDTFNNKAPTTSPTFATSITGSYLTASEILITGASKEVISAPVATYPSLAELAHLKGMTSKVIDDDQIDTFSELDAIVVDKDLVNKADGAVWLGTHNYSDAFVTLPSTIGTAEGAIRWNSASKAAEVYTDGNKRILPTVLPISRVIWDPDGIQSTEDAIPLLYINPSAYPNGITIASSTGTANDGIQLYADTANTASIGLEEWSYEGVWISDIGTITFANSTVASMTAVLSDADIAAESRIYVDLDTTDLNWLDISIPYWIKEND